MGLGLNAHQTIHEANDHGRHASIVKGKRASFVNNILIHWIRMNLVEKVFLKCIILVSISFCWYTFLNFCTQICHPVAYGVHISSKASPTAAQNYQFWIYYCLSQNDSLIKLYSQVLFTAMHCPAWFENHKNVSSPFSILFRWKCGSWTTRGSLKAPPATWCGTILTGYCASVNLRYTTVCLCIVNPTWRSTWLLVRGRFHWH